MANKIEFRCKGCSKLLATTNGDTDIVCPRCGGMNKLSIGTNRIEFTPKRMRQRTTSSGMRFER